jgi:hypothetical protein
MKKIRKFASNAMFIIALLLVFTTHACNIGSKKFPVKDYNGEMLLKGIFFGEGEVASKIPEYSEIMKIKSDLTAEEKMEYDKAQAFAISELIKGDPRFFEKFAISIKSGNNITIRNELEKTANLVYNILEDYYQIKLNSELLVAIKGKINKDDFSKENKLKFDIKKIRNLEKELNTIKELRQGGGGMARPKGPVTCAAVVAVAFIVVAVVIEYWFWGMKSSRTSELEKEQVINSISTIFKK